jgi:hypothetical protein
VYDGPPIRLARLAMLVPAAAEAGDQVAQLIVDRAVTLLADTADALLSRDPADALLSRDPADALLSRDPADALVSRDPTNPLVSRDTADALPSRDPANPLVSRDPADALVSRDPADALVSRDPIDALASRDTADLLASRDTADALVPREPADGPLSGPAGAACGPVGPVVLAGSLLTAEGPIRREVQRRISERYGRAPLVAGEGAGGAAWLAARRLGLQPGPAVHQRLTAASTSAVAADRAAAAAEGSRSIHAEMTAPP